jgi:polysaccharide pyruvyl transferase CsaB
MNKKIALLLGAYGQDNLGDELLLDKFIKLLHGYEVWANSTDPEQTAAQHQINTFSTNKQPLTLLKRLLQAKLVVFGGGSQFKELPDIFGRHALSLLLQILIITFVSRVLGKPVYFMSVGAGPLVGGGSRFLTRWIVRLSSKVVLRDSASFELMNEVTANSKKLVLGADGLFIGEAVPVTKDASKSVVLIPNLHTKTVELQEVQLQIFADTATWLLAQGYSVKLLPFQKSFTAVNDLIASQKIVKRVSGLSDTDILTEVDEQNIYSILAAQRFVVSVRLHGVIVAALCNTPSIGISYDPKVTGIMTDLGLGEYVVELDENASAAKVIEMANKIEQNYQPLATTISTGVAKFFTANQEALNQIKL